MDIKRIEKLKLDRPPEPDEADRGRTPGRGRGVALLALLVAVGFAGKYFWAGSMKPRETAQPAPPAAVSRGSPVPAAELPSTFTAAGYLEPIPPYPITVSTLVPGRVDEFSVLEGTAVKAGAVLAKLNPALQQMRLAELEAENAVIKARLAQAEQVLARAEKLAAIGSVAAKELERAQAEVAVARAEQQRVLVAQDTAKWQRDSTVIRAPVDGVVFERLVQVGEFVSPNSMLIKGAGILTLYDPAKVQVWADVTQRDAGRIKLGQRVSLSIDAEPNKTFAGRVVRIQPRASLQKNTVQVKVSVEDPSPMLRPDMSAKLTFHADEPASHAR